MVNNQAKMQLSDTGKRTTFQYAIARHEGTIAWVTLLGMWGLGVVAAVTYLARRESFVGDLRLLVPAILGFLAAVVGAFIIPIHITCLRRKSMVTAVPIIYGAGFFWIIGSQFLLVEDSVLQLLSTTAGTVAVVIVAAVGCWFRLADVPELVAPELCPNCRYHIRGVAEPGCPECGWGREDSR